MQYDKIREQSALHLHRLEIPGIDIQKDSRSSRKARVALEDPLDSLQDKMGWYIHELIL